MGSGADRADVFLGEDGLPVEASTAAGYDVPVISVPPFILVRLDGAEVRDAVAYSLIQGWVISAKHDAAGGLIVEGDHVATEKRTGLVSIERIGEAL